MTIFHDDFGNTATIEEKMIYPHKDAKHKEKAFILSLTSDYDNNFLYHRSIYDNMKDLVDKLSKFSCNTWK